MDGIRVSQKYKSFTLVETLVAIAVLLIAIVAPLSLAHKSLQSTSVTRDQLMAFYLAQDAVDYMKKIRDQNISNEVLWTSRFPSCVQTQASNCVFSVDTSKGVATAFDTACPGDVCPPLTFDTVTGRYGYNSAWSESVYRRTIRVTPIVANKEMDVAVTVEWQGGKLGGTYTAHQSMFNLLGNVCRDLSGNIDYTCSGAGGGSGSLCGNGVLDGGEQCDGSLFNVTCSSLGYSGGALSCNSNCTANTSGCTSAPSTYTLTINKTGSGTVTGSGISCGASQTTCSYSGLSGNSTLAANPSSGSSFSSWSGCTSTAGNSCQVTMSSNKTVTATFGASGPTPDTTPPSAPSNVSATPFSASQINLSWTASTDNVGVTGYRIYRCAGVSCTPSSPAIATVNSGTTYSDTGLSAATTYRYQITAGDAAGNWSSGSSVVSATTQASAPTTVYLSDLTPQSSSNGWGPVEKDKSNGENLANDGNTLTIAGTTYAKGLGTHANSSVVYNLGGQYTRFQARAGVDDEVGNGGSVQFTVIVDGVWTQSSYMYGTGGVWTFDVNTTGASTLELRVLDAGDGVGDDHADWADAKLIKP